MNVYVPGLLKTMMGFLTYKEPANEELGFELLEGEKEGVYRENKHRESAKSSRDKAAKSPLTVEEWNESRKSGAQDAQCLPETDSDCLSCELCVNLATIRQKFHMGKNRDVMVREFRIGRRIKAFLVFVEGMMDKQILNLSIFPQLMAKDVLDELGEECPIDFLLENVLTVHDVSKTNKFSEANLQVLSGMSALFVDGCGECIVIETRGFEKRSVEKPLTETVIKGAQEGFTENLRTNVTLVRRIIKNENLVTEMMRLGNTNHSTCAVMYLQGIASQGVVKEVKKRLGNINTDLIIGDGMIEQFIEDNSLMLFPQVLTTERPDRTASFLVEGQVIIISEGTPFAIAVPVTFFRLFHTSEDAFVRWPASNFLRAIRLAGLFCATYLPGLYVAAALFHPEMIPTELLASISIAKEAVPFPTIVEVLIMELAFELIREGGIRVPSIIGQTLGIVGALILGQAAVSASLVSPIVVIIVSITALGNFAIPNYSLAIAIRIERFFFILIAAFFGFYGISLVTFLLLCTACSMKSFGVPFFAPVAPKTRVNPDVVIRHPIWRQKQRPDEMNTPNRKRQGENTELWIAKENTGRKGKSGKNRGRE